MKSEITKYSEDNFSTIEVKFVFPVEDLQLNETSIGIRVSLNECSIFGPPGGPELPSKIIRLALPQNTKVTEVLVKTGKVIRLNKKSEKVAPIQPPQIAGKYKEPSPRKVNEKDRPDFASNSFEAPEFFPPQSKLYENEMNKRHYWIKHIKTEQNGPLSIAVIKIMPLRTTRKGFLRFAPKIIISVKCAKTAKSATDTASKFSTGQIKRFIDLTKGFVLNPEDVDNFDLLADSLPSLYDYIIVTDNQNWNETTLTAITPTTPEEDPGDLVQEFQRLADWKNRRGLKAKVVTISDIVSGSIPGENVDFKNQARDLQEVIRNFLKWAYDNWGISWVLLGGDVNIVPVRIVAGCLPGHYHGEITIQTRNDPPENAEAYWETCPKGGYPSPYHTFLKMNATDCGELWLYTPDSWDKHCLVRQDNGLLIPYIDSVPHAGPMDLFWWFCENDSYNTRSYTPTNFVFIKGIVPLWNGTLSWLYYYNTISTDLYYSSLKADQKYNLPGKHDWDLNDNKIYGQSKIDYTQTDNSDFDGVEFRADVSVGRAPVSKVIEAKTFVDKVIAYEQFRNPDGSMLPLAWPSKMLIASSGQGFYGSGFQFQRGVNYQYDSGNKRSVLDLGSNTVTSDYLKLIIITANEDILFFEYDTNAATTGRGWYYCLDNGNFSPSEQIINGVSQALPTKWIVVYSQKVEELTPKFYLLYSQTEKSNSVIDQENLRAQIQNEIPQIANFYRIYQDLGTLTPSQIASTPIEYLLSGNITKRLNEGYHFLSLCGEGDPTGCCGLYTARPGNTQNLVNGYQTFITFANACLTNQFDSPDQLPLSKALLNNQNGGAVAYVGFSRFGYSKPEGGGESAESQSLFFHALTPKTNNLGLLNDSRLSIAQEGAYQKWIVFAQNLMGDPEMPVWIGTPVNMNMSGVPSELNTGDQELNLIVTDDCWLPIGDVVITATLDNALLEKCITDANGNAVLRLSLANPGNLEIVASYKNAISAIQTCNIKSP